MAVAFVSRANTNTHAAGTSVAAPAHAHTAGNLLVVVIQSQTAGPSSVTDTAGNTYVATGSSPFQDQSSGLNRQSIYYAKNITGHASNVVTANFPSSYTYLTIAVYEFSGADATAPLIGDSHGTDVSGTVLSTGSLSLSVSSVIVAIYLPGVTTVTAGTGYTQFQQDDGGFVWDSYHITSTSEAATATQSASAAWDIFAAAFSSVASGGGGGVVPVIMNSHRQHRNYRKRPSGLWIPPTFAELYQKRAA